MSPNQKRSLVNLRKGGFHTTESLRDIFCQVTAQPWQVHTDGVTGRHTSRSLVCQQQESPTREVKVLSAQSSQSASRDSSSPGVRPALQEPRRNKREISPPQDIFKEKWRKESPITRRREEPGAKSTNAAAQEKRPSESPPKEGKGRKGGKGRKRSSRVQDNFQYPDDGDYGGRGYPQAPQPEREPQRQRSWSEGPPNRDSRGGYQQEAQPQQWKSGTKGGVKGSGKGKGKGKGNTEKPIQICRCCYYLNEEGDYHHDWATCGRRMEVEKAKEQRKEAAKAAAAPPLNA